MDPCALTFLVVLDQCTSGLFFALNALVLKCNMIQRVGQPCLDGLNHCKFNFILANTLSLEISILVYSTILDMWGIFTLTVGCGAGRFN